MSDDGTRPPGNNGDSGAGTSNADTGNIENEQEQGTNSIHVQLEENSRKPDFKFRLFWWAFALTFLFYLYTTDKHMTKVDNYVCVCTVGTVSMFCILIDASTRREKFLLLLLIAGHLFIALGLNFFSDHSCTMCALETPKIVHEYLVPNAGELMDANVRNSGTDTWRLLLEKDNPVPEACRDCHDFIFWFRHNGPEYITNKLGLLEIFSNESGAELLEDEDLQLEEIENRFSPSSLRALDEWYLDIQEKTYPKQASKLFLRALASGVKKETGSLLLANATKQSMCYPASRFSGPKPSEYLLALQRPRFTGESDEHKTMNISMAKLKAIMRGDAMRKLGPHVCFMVRLAGVLQEDPSILTDTISPSNVQQIRTEKKMKGVDASYFFPGLWVPRTDEDKDRDGSGADMSEALLSLFISLPLKDWNPEHFETKEEYIAFFRWTMEHKLQDEYYFPKWLSHGEIGTGEHHKRLVENLVEQTGNLVAHQFRFNNERLALTHPTSDETLSDRAFFGTGMKRMTRIKLPGDPDYKFLHPFGPDYFESEEHREFFRNTQMPPEKEFLRMGKDFWKEERPLEYFRDKVVEISYMVATHWEHRELFEDQGAILYLEASSRKVMGIWVAALDEMVFPDDGRRWEYAKFHYRSTELTVMAMRHVAEYHLGWANIFSNAIRQTLPPEHGLRVFIKPYTHGTPAVNWNAYQMLIRNRSVLHRASGLTALARGHTWGHIQKHFEMGKPFPQVLKDKGLDGMSNLTETIPYFSQGLRLYQVHRDFVEGMLEILYKTDEEIKKDTDLYRFWNHINTYGRHMDPCVCGMESELFFEEDRWPGFESNENRTCGHLMDFAEVKEMDDQVKRRDIWCRRHELERTRSLYSLLKAECEAKSCEGIFYDFLHMRANFALPDISREVLTDVLATFIFEVTANHELVADNVPYMVDPSYGGVRVLRKDEKDKLPLKVDIATYIFGTVIAALTTMRSKPLLSDWSNLLIDWAENQADIKELSDDERTERKHEIALLHFEYKASLVALSNDFLRETKTLKNQNQWTPFLIPATQATSIAV